MPRPVSQRLTYVGERVQTRTIIDHLGTRLVDIDGQWRPVPREFGHMFLNVGNRVYRLDHFPATNTVVVTYVRNTAEELW